MEYFVYVHLVLLLMVGSLKDLRDSWCSFSCENILRVYGSLSWWFLSFHERGRTWTCGDRWQTKFRLLNPHNIDQSWGRIGRASPEIALKPQVYNIIPIVITFVNFIFTHVRTFIWILPLFASDRLLLQTPLWPRFTQRNVPFYLRQVQSPTRLSLLLFLLRGAPPPHNRGCSLHRMFRFHFLLTACIYRWQLLLWFILFELNFLVLHVDLTQLINLSILRVNIWDQEYLLAILLHGGIDQISTNLSFILVFLKLVDCFHVLVVIGLNCKLNIVIVTSLLPRCHHFRRLCFFSCWPMDLSKKVHLVLNSLEVLILNNFDIKLWHNVVHKTPNPLRVAGRARVWIGLDLKLIHLGFEMRRPSVVKRGQMRLVCVYSYSAHDLPLFIVNLSWKAGFMLGVRGIEVSSLWVFGVCHIVIGVFLDCLKLPLVSEDQHLWVNTARPVRGSIWRENWLGSRRLMLSVLNSKLDTFEPITLLWRWQRMWWAHDRFIHSWRADHGMLRAHFPPANRVRKRVVEVLRPALRPLNEFLTGLFIFLEASLLYLITWISLHYLSQ